MYRYLPHLAVACLLLAATLALGACAKPAPPLPAPPRVGVIPLEPQRVEVATRLSGRATAYMTSEVRPQVGGILQHRLFEEGQDVVAGQVLYQIDPRTYQAAWQGARAELLKAEAAVRAARPKAERYAKLLGMDAVSRQDGEDVQAALDTDLAAVAAAKAALAAARINLDYTRVVAPISGRIGTSSYTPGALVTAGQESVLATIQQLDPVHVDVAQSSTQLLALHNAIDRGELEAVDGKVQVSLQLADGSVYKRRGTLEVIGTTVDATTGGVTLRIVVPNPDHTLLPGMFVQALLPMAQSRAAFVIPQRLVSRDPQGVATVKLVDRRDFVEERQVTPEYAFKDQWVIIGGLHRGDRLIADGASRVSGGQRVTPFPFASAPPP